MTPYQLFNVTWRLKITIEATEIIIITVQGIGDLAQDHLHLTTERDVITDHHQEVIEVVEGVLEDIIVHLPKLNVEHLRHPLQGLMQGLGLRQEVQEGQLRLLDEVLRQEGQ